MKFYQEYKNAFRILSKGRVALDVFSKGVKGATLISIAAASILMADVAPIALPSNPAIISGNVNINTSASNMTINQSTNTGIINWGSFNIGSSASVQFNQPNITSSTLNRVVGGELSQIAGSLSATGKVILINPNGVIFANGSRVDVGGIVASTMNISDTNYLNNNMYFTRDGSNGKVINQGTLTASEKGYIALLAPEVQNEGVIIAQKGSAVMASGDAVTLNADDTGLLHVSVDGATVNTLIKNKGLVEADGGVVYMSAKAASDAYAATINNEGTVQASSMVEKGGKIVLLGTNIANSGTIEAKGATGGGEILIGGDYQGTNLDIYHQATTTTLTSTSTIDASATDNGDGGKVVIWSDIHNANSVTTVQGSITAKGGPNGGDGGKIETSGHAVDTAGVTINAGADRGTGGLWLIDPYDYVISNASSINTSLDSGTSVTIDTANASSGSYSGTSGSGTITISDNITKSSGAASTLTLNADNSISGTGAINSSGNTLGVVFNAGSGTGLYSGLISGNVNLTKSGAGTLTLTGANTYTGGTTVSAGTLQLGNGGTTGSLGSGYITVNNGTLAFNYSAGNYTVGSTSTGTYITLINATVNAISGNVTLAGYAAYSGTASAANIAVNILGSTSLSASAGASLTLAGKTENTYSHGIALQNGAALSTSGDVTLTATGTGGAGWNHLMGLYGTNSITAASGSALTINVNQTVTDWALAQYGSTAKTNVSGNVTFNLSSAGSWDLIATKAWGDTSTYYGPAYTSTGGTLTFNLQGATTGGIHIGPSGPGTYSASATGAIIINAATTSGNTPTFVLAGAANTIYTGAGSLTINAPIETNGYGLTFTGGSGLVTVNGNISGTGSLTQSTTGTTILTGTNTYTGATTISSGQLIIQHDAPSLTTSGFSGAGSLIVQSAGNTFTSAFDFNKASSGLSSLTIGKSTNTGAVTISAAQSIAGPITVYGGNISVNAGLTSTASGAAINLQGTGWIKQAANVAVTTNNGNVTYISNYGNNTTSAAGGIVLNSGSSITTSGGAINLGTSSNYAIGAVTDTSGSTVYAGVLLYGSALNAGTGDISIYGKSTYTVGNNGIGVWSNISTVSGGNITLIGYGSASNTNLSNYGVGLDGTTTLTASGNLSVTGTGGGTGASAAANRGVETNGATLQTTTGGTITLMGTVGNGTVGTNYNYALDINSSIIGDASRTGNVVLNGDSINFMASSATNTINTSGTVTINSTSSSFTTAFNSTNLTLNSSISGLTIGKSTNTADITINSATSIAGPISIYGGNISINSNLTSTLSNAEILLQGTGWIKQASGVAVTTSGGNVSYISNYGNNTTSAVGGIVLNSGSSITTSGGAINLGSSSNYAIGAVTSGSTTVYAGVLLYNGTLNAGTGDISVFGKSTYTAGSYGIGVWFNNSTVTGGNITLIGYGSASNTNIGNYGVGLDGGTTLTASGNLSVTGTGGGTGASNSFNRGILTANASMETTGGGTITLTGTVGNGTVGTNYNYALDLYGTTIGSGTETGNIVLKGDSILVETASTINTSGTVTIAPLGTSFYSALTYPMTNLTVDSRATGLTIGSTTNTANITIGSATSIAGPITVYGGNISVNANLSTSTASGAAINLQGTGWINQAANVAVTTNNGNVTYISNYGTSSGGGIVLNSGSSITTSGGAINLGSSSNYAIGAVTDGSSGNYEGVLLYGSTLNAGTGAISIYGKSTATSGYGIGVWFKGSTVIGGNITLDGYGSIFNSTPGVGNYGVGLDDGTTLTASGNLSVTGTGGGTGASNFANRGVEMNGATLKTTGGGTITLTGTVGNGTVGANYNYALQMYSATIGSASQTGNVVLNGDSIDFGNADTINTSGTVTIVPLGTSFYSGGFNYPTTLTVNSRATGLTIGSATNTADITIGSATSIAGPITVYGGNISLSAGLTTTNATTGDISLYGNVSGAGAISLANNRVLTITEAGTSSYSGIISGMGASLVKAGTGTLTLTGAETYTGNTTISAGTLQIGAGSTAGSLASASIVDNTSLVFNRSDNLTYAGVVSGSGSLNQSGSGVLTLSGDNTYSGGSTVNANGTIKAASATALGTGVVTVNSIGMVDVNGQSLGNAWQIAGTGKYTGNTGSAAILNSANTDVSLGGNIALLGDAVIRSSGTGALTLNGTIDGAHELLLTSKGAYTQNGVVGGSTPLTSYWVDTLTGGSFDASHTANISLNAAVTVNGNMFLRGNDIAFSNGLAMTNANSNSSTTYQVSLAAAGKVTGTGDIALAGTSLLWWEQAGSSTYGRRIQGASATLLKSGSGTLILTGTNVYDQTQIYEGVLQVGNGGSTGNLGSGDVLVDTPALFKFNRSDAITVANNISGAGAVSHVSGNSLSLTGVASYTGATEVTSGSLLMQNDAQPATSGFTGAGTVAIEPASSAFSSSFNSGYTFASTLTGLRLGKEGSTSVIALNSAIAISGPISVYGGNINVNANLTSTLSNAEILLKATNSILISGGTSSSSKRTIQTNNGNIVLWADSDSDSSGRINLANYTTLNSANGSTSSLSGGGKIILAGGSDNGTNGGVSGDNLPDGYAFGTGDSNSAGSSIQLGAVGTTPTIGSIDIYSGGGNIRILGASYTGAMSNLNQAHGIFSNGGLIIITPPTNKVNFIS